MERCFAATSVNVIFITFEMLLLRATAGVEASHRSFSALAWSLCFSSCPKLVLYDADGSGVCCDIIRNLKYVVACICYLTLKTPFHVQVHLNFKIKSIKFGDLNNCKMTVPEVELILLSPGLSYTSVPRVSTRIIFSIFGVEDWAYMFLRNVGTHLLHYITVK